MKLLTAIFMSLLTISGWAFTYELQKHPSLPKDSELLLNELNGFFEERELSQIYLPSGFKETGYSLAKVDRIYSGGNGETTVFIKTGVIPSNPKLMEETYSMENGFIRHFKKPNGLIFAVYVLTNHITDADEIFKNLGGSFTTLIPKKSSFNFINKAHADECEKPSTFEKLKDKVQEMTTSVTPVQHVATCMMMSAKGLWEGSGGVVVGATKAVAGFITSPIESGKKFWESSSKLWEASKKFISDFENEAGKMYQGFLSLDPLKKTELICEAIGAIGGSVLLTYLTAGALSSATLLKLKKTISTILNSKKHAPLKKKIEVEIPEKLSAMEIEAKGSVYDIERGHPELAMKINESVLKDLNELKVKTSPNRKAGLSDDEILNVFRKVKNHPVAATSKVDVYSKTSPGMGYCFGRAMTSHLTAIAQGLDKNSIRKVWVVGNLGKWTYHVSTIVKDTKGQWYAIDPILSHPMKVEDWYKTMKTYDQAGDLRIIHTEAKRYGPGSDKKYDPNELKKAVYDGYFNDLRYEFKLETDAIVKERKAQKI